jgi:hypothetical protein
MSTKAHAQHDAVANVDEMDMSLPSVSLHALITKLLVRAVYKMLTVPSSGKVGVIHNGQLGALGSNGSPVRRCDLELPSYEKSSSSTSSEKGKSETSETSKSEIEAALRSKEVNCKPASDFLDLKVGQWYSETATFDFSGCEGVQMKGAKYTPTMPYITHNPGPGFLLAKFEVQEA